MELECCDVKVDEKKIIKTLKNIYNRDRKNPIQVDQLIGVVIHAVLQD